MTGRIQKTGVMNMDKDLNDGDADGKLQNDQLLMAARVAAARLYEAVRMNDVIEHLLLATTSSGLFRRPC